ncbi:MAG: hypothetical protein P8N31_10115, partial [Planctomycetota bacterium]|nr:hypothetical protein [Planctomycetota bacterium]
ASSRSASLHAHPTLSVVNYPRKNDFEFMDYGPTWVPDVAQTQWLLSSLSPNDHPLKKQDILARASAHWREAGRRYCIAPVGIGLGR